MVPELVEATLFTNPLSKEVKGLNISMRLHFTLLPSFLREEKIQL